MYAYGLGDTGATLAAHYEGQPSAILTNAPGQSPGTFKLWIISLDTDLQWIEYNPGKVAGHPHFPYGFPVEADGPM